MSGLVGHVESLLRGAWGLVRAAAPRDRHTSPGEVREGGFVLGTSLPLDDSAGPPGAPVVLSEALLSKHACIYGGSGTGKSTLMRRMRLHAYRMAHAVLDVDFAGDASDAELRQLAGMGGAAPETALIDMRQGSWVAGLNLLGGPGSPHARAAAFAKALRSEAENWGVRVNYNAVSGAVALAELGYGATEFRALFAVEPGFRRHVMSRLEDEMARAALAEFDGLPPETQRAHWLELANKLHNFVFDPALRLMLGQPGFPDLSGALDRPARTTLVALGAARQPAAVLVAKTLLAAVDRHVMGRAEANEDSRQPARLFVDEASRVAGFGLESLLAEGRRMKCALTLALQHSQQVEPALRAAMRANASVQVFFAAGGTEAAELASEIVCDLARDRVRDVLISLEVGQALVVRRGEKAVLCQMPDSPVPAVDSTSLEAFRTAALARAAVPREEAEEELRRRGSWIAGLDAREHAGEPEVLHRRRPARKRGEDE